LNIRRTLATAVVAARRGPFGTKISYSLSENASTTLAIEKGSVGRRRGSSCVRRTRRNAKAKRCTRYVRKGVLTRTGAQGPNTVAFSGRIGRRKLSPGAYRVGIAATDLAGNTGLPQYKRFTILKPKATKRR
jgi:hypothetical protein